MLFKPGDKVMIRADLKHAEYSNVSNDITDSAVPQMLQYAGHITTIVKYNIRDNEYILLIDNGQFWWTERMFDLKWKDNMTLSDYANKTLNNIKE